MANFCIWVRGFVSVEKPLIEGPYNVQNYHWVPPFVLPPGVSCIIRSSRRISRDGLLRIPRFHQGEFILCNVAIPSLTRETRSGGK